jgi:two-component system, NarL family, response regulator DevR
VTRVFVVDDHEIVRRGLVDLISTAADLDVVGESDSVARTVDRVAATRPDVVVLDVRLPDGDGIDLCRSIRSAHPDTRCLMLTAYDDDEASVAAVLAGASGYVLKSIRSQNLLDTIRRVADGQSLLSTAITDRVRSSLQDSAQQTETTPALTLREHQVLRLITDGLTNRQIGERLGLAEKTVKNYVSALLAKLGMKRRTQAAVYGATHQDRPERGDRV